MSLSDLNWHDNFRKHQVPSWVVIINVHGSQIYIQKFHTQIFKLVAQFLAKVLKTFFSQISLYSKKKKGNFLDELTQLQMSIQLNALPAHPHCLFFLFCSIPQVQQSLDCQKRQEVQPWECKTDNYVSENIWQMISNLS